MWVQSLETSPCGDGGKLGFERRPPRGAHCVPFTILNDVAHVFSSIASGCRRYGDRRHRESVGQIGRWWGVP